MGASESVPQKSIHEFTVKMNLDACVGWNRTARVMMSTSVSIVERFFSSSMSPPNGCLFSTKYGFTDTNYTQLAELYKRYSDEGLEILAFPCNQFLKQEPGTSEDAEQFACTRYKAEYPIFQKVRVNGANAAPVYKFLKASKGSGFTGRGIKWNFTKFLVDKGGRVLQRYGPTTPPLAFEKDIQQALREA